LCWKTFKKIDEPKSENWTPDIMVTDLVQETGKLANIVKGLEGFQPSEKHETKEMLAAKLCDVLYIVFVLAEHYGINLEETFLQAVNDRVISNL
jgi:NTP pyrophosphatase (non-canonical NTP hydrolase)